MKGGGVFLPFRGEQGCLWGGLVLVGVFKKLIIFPMCIIWYVVLQILFVFLHMSSTNETSHIHIELASPFPWLRSEMIKAARSIQSQTCVAAEAPVYSGFVWRDTGNKRCMVADKKGSDIIILRDQCRPDGERKRSRPIVA